MPADPDTLSGLPVRDVGTDGVNASGNFMTGNSRILNARPESFLDEDIAMTNATGFHLDADLATARVWNISFDEFETAASFSYLHCFHASHFFPLSCWYKNRGCRLIR